jgi:hypothetical protein
VSRAVLPVVWKPYWRWGADLRLHGRLQPPQPTPEGVDAFGFPLPPPAPPSAHGHDPPHGFLGVCGHCRKGRLAQWEPVLDASDQPELPTLERGFVRQEVEGRRVYVRSQARADRFVLRGRERERLEKRTGQPLPSYRSPLVRGPAVPWEAVVICPDCRNWGQISRPPSR